MFKNLIGIGFSAGAVCGLDEANKIMRTEGHRTQLAAAEYIVSVKTKG